jgi:alpha-galactosidase
MIGSHVASPRSSSTGRQHDLSLRLIVALFGHQGIEWDITTCSPAEKKALAEWVSLVKSFRSLLHSGQLVRLERPRDPGTSLFGVVAQDGAEALFALVRSHTSPYWGTPPMRLDGLQPTAHYSLARVAVPGEDVPPPDSRTSTAPWPVRALGAVLMRAGVQVPFLNPDQGLLFHVVREADG